MQVSLWDIVVLREILTLILLKHLSTYMISFDIIRDHWDLVKPVSENFEDFKKEQ